MYTDLICCHKLTKKFLMSLETGLFICSNVYDDDTESLYSIYQKPALSEKVISLSTRERQWNKIKEKTLNGRTFQVFKNEADYCSWFEDFIKDNIIGNHCRIKEDIVGYPYWN
jgi:hypothetical protein